MWRHWGLDRDPFLGPSRFVPLAEHREAVERLRYTVEAGQPLAWLTGGEGLGKSIVLRQALAEIRRADRRIVLVENPVDAPSLWRMLADQIEGKIGPATERAETWIRLERAAKVCTIQGRRLVLAIDGGEGLDRGDLQRLARLEGATILLAQRDPDVSAAPWTLAIRLRPLTRSDAENYLTARLAAVGCREPIFTPRAVVRLHAAARGVPRGMNQLASMALIAAAMRGMEAVSSEVVDGVALECRAAGD
ncbi:ExeA family protein [Paludisphaera rhizosphaerae]|nr:type II secretory pathway protein ExeA [Paludisphaera rhizosphaerae]